MSGFLAGAQDAWGVDFCEAKEFVGTSAGSIVAAHLAKGIEPRVPQEPVRAAQADVADRDIYMAGVERSFQEWVTALYYTTRHHGQRGGGCVGPRRPPCRSAGWHAINGGPQ
jgi:predicted acylesterase/phospholipase RssA